MKKTFIISLVSLAVVLFFLGVYNFAFKKDTPIAQTPATQIPAVSGISSEKITAVSDQTVIGPVFDNKNESLLYYSAKDGTAWTSEPNGKAKKQISDTKLVGLKNVLWSPDHSKVLTTFNKNGRTSFSEYDYQTQKGVQLDGGIDWVVWDNLGTKIFYKYYDAAAKKRSFNIANPDGSEWQKLADLSLLKISIAPVPGTSLVSFWSFPSAKEETQLSVVGVAGGNVQIILKGKFGADYLWSPDGSQALVSSLAGDGSKVVTLGLVKTSGEYHDLNIPTFVSKCAWSADGNTLYYALPGGIPEGAVMPDDYMNNKFLTEDTFWKMDIVTGEKSRVIAAADIKGKYDSSNLFISATEDGLYFVNKSDGKLYKLSF